MMATAGSLNLETEGTIEDEGKDETKRVSKQIKRRRKDREYGVARGVDFKNVPWGNSLSLSVLYLLPIHHFLRAFLSFY